MNDLDELCQGIKTSVDSKEGGWLAMTDGVHHPTLRLIPYHIVMLLLIYLTVSPI